MRVSRKKKKNKKQKKKNPAWLLSPRHGLRFSLPESLLDRQAEIAGVVDWRLDYFLTCCSKWRDAKKCAAAIKKSKVTIVDDYTFKSPYSTTGLAGGSFSNRRVKVCLYNKLNLNSLEECENANGVLIRDRAAMAALAKLNKSYWLKHPNSHFCGNPNDLLPALVHELCHSFGDNVGHKAGKEDCQP